MKNKTTIFVFLCFISPSIFAQTADDFFDSTKIQEIRLTLDPASFDALRTAAYGDDTYYSGTFTWNNITLAADMRQKGRVSRVSEKPSFKLKFSKKDRFVGLRELELKANTQDASQLHQMVTMPVFERMGLPGRRQSHARVFINDRLLGLYLAVEFVNEDYLERVLGNNDGVLYDFGPDPGYNFEYKGDDPAAYLWNFDPDQPDDPDHTSLVLLIQAINLSPDEQFKDAVGQYLDWQEFLDYLAVEQYLAEDDGIIGEWGMNNFYLYRNTGTKKFVFIPTDRDLDFHTSDMPLLQRVDNNVLVKRALANPALRQMFFDAVKRVMAVTGGKDGWLQRTAEWRMNMIRDAVYEDPNKQCDGAPCANDRFEASALWVMQIAEQRPDFVAGELTAAGVPPSDESHQSVSLTSGAVTQIAWSGSDATGAQVWINGFPAEVLSSDSSQITFETPLMVWPGTSNAWIVTSDGGASSFPVAVLP